MHRFFSFLLSLFLIALGFAIVGDFCHQKTHGFTLQKIVSSKKEISEKSPLSSQELHSIQKALNQPFRFLSKGHQCYAFISQDEKYILKFLRWNKIEPPFWTEYLPPNWTHKFYQDRKEKKSLDFASYEIAFNELKEETGVLYLHLEKTKFLNTSLCLYDAIKVRYFLPSDDVEFILQKKVDLFPSYLEKNKKNTEELYSFFSKLTSLLSLRYQKGIHDSDISLEYNMGVIDGNPILFDIGNLKKEKESLSKQDFLQKESKLVQAFLKRKYPEFNLYFEKELEKESNL